jgi:tetratricopeptide (TPR) repeat protein
MEKDLEKEAKIFYNNKKYKECLESCFKCMSINPNLQWEYDLCGYCYFNLGMYSQSRGCFNVAKNMDNDEQKILNYNKLIELTYEKEKSNNKFNN